jgi:hypothetical protein
MRPVAVDDADVAAVVVAAMLLQRRKRSATRALQRVVVLPLQQTRPMAQVELMPLLPWAWA